MLVFFRSWARLGRFCLLLGAMWALSVDFGVFWDAVEPILEAPGKVLEAQKSTYFFLYFRVFGRVEVLLMRHNRSFCDVLNFVCMAHETNKLVQESSQ